MSPDQRTRHVLVEHGFPAGLLPAAVHEAHFDEATGGFRVSYTVSHSRRVDGYHVSFGTEVHGTLRHGVVAKLQGVRVKKGLWLPVSGITAVQDQLEFHIGPLRKRVSASAFRD